MRTHPNRHRLAAPAAALVLLLVAGGAVAATADRSDPSGSQLVTACVNVKTGMVRIPTTSSPCVSSGPRGTRDRVMTWSQEGVPGADGSNGAAGPVGQPGPTGATGATGAAGAVGPTGASGAPGSTGPSGSAGPSGPPGRGDYAAGRPSRALWCDNEQVDIALDTVQHDGILPSASGLLIGEDGRYRVEFLVAGGGADLFLAKAPVNGDSAAYELRADVFLESPGQEFHIGNMWVLDLAAGDVVGLHVSCNGRVFIEEARLLIEQIG